MKKPPLYVQVHPADNVAIIVSPDGLTLAEHIPQSHKVALSHIASGGPIIRYGQIIGHAKRDIAQNSCPRGVTFAAGRPFIDDLPLATATPPPLPLTGYTFKASAIPTARPYQEHPRHRHHRAMRRANGGLRRAPHQGGNPTAPSGVDDVAAVTHLRLRRRH